LRYTSYHEDYRRHHLGEALFVPQAMTPDELESGYRWAVREISRCGGASRRAWRTWRETGNPFSAAISLAWPRTGLRARTGEG